MAITVKDAYYKAGYSRVDHLLDNDDLAGVVGKSFPSVRDAQRAAEALRQPIYYTGRRGPNTSPIGLRIRFADGEERAV